MKNKLPISNSILTHCIDEYVMLEEDREILKERYFKGYTIEKLCRTHDKSETYIKTVLRDTGDNILMRASEMTKLFNDMTHLYQAMNITLENMTEKI